MNGRSIKRNRTYVVGAFVSGVGVLLVIVILWLVGSRFLRPVDRYRIVFKRSVSGLSPGAAVEVNGVAVGKVMNIHLTRESPPRVVVEIETKPGTPIRRDSTATLSGSLVTGIRFVEIRGGSEQAGPLSEDEPMPVDESSFDDIRTQASALSKQTLMLLGALNQDILNKNNRETFGQLMQDMSASAHSLKVITSDFATPENMAELKKTLANLSETTARLNDTVNTFSSHRNEIYGNLDSALKRLDKTLADAQRIVLSVDGVVTRSTGEIDQTLHELHRTSRHLDETVQGIQADPSVLLWGSKISDREKTQ
jgi:phospholipid/cholesterol/gamma-HCH transport system substrate-binding protein